EFFTATKVTDDLIGQAAMEAEMQRAEIPAALKKHIKELAIAMGKQKVLDQAVINHAVRRDSRDSPEGKKKSCRTLRRKQAEGLKRDRELKQGFPMLLRSHPLLSHRGFHSWPPVCAWTGGVKNQRPKGEVGILRKVILSRAAGISARCISASIAAWPIKSSVTFVAVKNSFIASSVALLASSSAFFLVSTTARAARSTFIAAATAFKSRSIFKLNNFGV